MTRLGSNFRKAIPSDSPAIAALVNSANSGDGGTSGWTNEREFFKGSRTDHAEVTEMMSVPGSLFVLCVESGEIVGCVYLRMLRGAGYMGLLAVRPAVQANGVGKELLAQGERIAREQWECNMMRISVLTSHRPELVAFYQRRGYVRTGRFKTLERKQEMKIAGLGAEWMEKELEGAHA